MNIDIKELKRHFYDYLELLIDGKEESIIVLNDGIPLVKLIPFSKRNTKRIGIIKDEQEISNLSLEDLNSIPINDFGL
ncbi:MAG: hypothetical protein IJS58_08115 [Bacilli bacterium]|nr:hypothetical protein [Bacilli bacterium]